MCFNSLELLPLLVTSCVTRMPVSSTGRNKFQVWIHCLVFKCCIFPCDDRKGGTEQTNRNIVLFRFWDSDEMRGVGKASLPHESNILSSPLTRVQEKPRCPLLPKTRTAMRAALYA